MTMRHNQKFKIVLFLLVFATKLLMVSAVAAQTTYAEIKFKNDSKLQVDFINDNIARIRIYKTTDAAANSGLNRYNFYNDKTSLKESIQVSKSNNKLKVSSRLLQIIADANTGSIVVNSNGKKLLQQKFFELNKNHTKVTFEPASSQEDWVGFGDQTRKRLYHRGYIADCDIRNARSYIPVPYFMSTEGVAVLVNTTYHIIFDMCKSNPDEYYWQNKSNSIDYYVMVGKAKSDFKDLIDVYTDFTGKPKLPPYWAFGLWYLCRMQANDKEVISDALNFRREKIPCDVIGLEPGWMEKNYDYSVNKQWSKDRFVMDDWIANGDVNFASALKRMGFKLELWLCNDYDLSYEEERKIGNNLTKKETISATDDANTILDKDAHLEAGKVYMDAFTIPNQPWFEHLKKFVDHGANFFKQDASNQVNRHPDRAWANGMSDAEMHNLYPLLYSRQMYDGYKNYKNLRPIVYTPCGWTGFQSYSSTWTGDTGGGLTTLGGMMNLALLGHSWSTVDMEVTSKEGIHFGYLSPWAQINSWTYYRMPWVQGDSLLNMHRSYSQLRSKLFPYLYSWAYQATKTGYPLAAPLTLEYPADVNCRNNLHQYFLGRDLLVGIFNNQNYFPAGEWKDYWTGEIIKGGKEYNVTWPEDKGGSLYIRSGAIIPFGPLMQYRGEKPFDSISLYIFPDEKGSSFNLYEDDGITFEHLKNKYALTSITQIKKNDGTQIKIAAPAGDFKDLIKNKKWSLIIHSVKKPLSVSANGSALQSWFYDDSRKEINIKLVEDVNDVLIKY